MTPFAGLAQLVEQRTCNAKVRGSTPLTGTSDSSTYANPPGLAFCFPGSCKHLVNTFVKYGGALSHATPALAERAAVQPLFFARPATCHRRFVPPATSGLRRDAQAPAMPLCAASPTGGGGSAFRQWRWACVLEFAPPRQPGPPTHSGSSPDRSGRNACRCDGRLRRQSSCDTRRVKQCPCPSPQICGSPVDRLAGWIRRDHRDAARASMCLPYRPGYAGP